MATMVCLFLLGWLGWRALHLPRPVPAPGKAAPPLALADASGRECTLASLRGKRVLLVFWASWSPLAVAQVGEIMALPPPAAGSERWETLGIVADGQRDEGAASTTKDLASPFPQLLADAATAEAWGGLPILPLVCEVGADGRIRRWHAGFTDRSTLLEWRARP